MAISVVKRFFSNSTDGLPILVATTSTNSGNIHTGPTATNVLDEVYLFANMDATQTAAITMTILVNSACYSLDVPVKALEYPILTGFPLWGRSASGTVLHVFASSTANLYIYGYVNRITET